VVYNITNCNS